MKKITLILTLISLFCITGFAQSNLFIWPIQGKNAGENILYRPNDYIADEINNSELILFAEENTPVVSPITGIITNFTYVYHKKYNSAIWFHLQPSADYEADCKELLKYNSKGIIDPKYITISIGIKMPDDRVVSIQGIKPEKIFKTGEKVSQGDVIGKVGYFYYKINKPCIAFSISKNGYGDDPMLPFGLKSTFKKFDKKKILSLTKEQALEDINVLVNAIEEGYPGLYDYLSQEEWKKIILSVKKGVSEKMLYKDFLLLLQHSFVNKIKDNHFIITTYLPINWDETHYMPSVFFGFLNDSLVITNTLFPYNNYFGKRVIQVNGIAVDSIKHLINNRIANIDGFTQSYIDYFLLAWTWNDINNVIDNPKSEYLVKFNNDSIVVIPSIKISANSKVCIPPYRSYWRDFVRHNTDSLTLLKVEDSIAYIGIHSFYLTEVEVNKIAAFIKQLQDVSCKHIIIDVRNNPGGDESVCAKLFSFFAQKPFITQEYSQVKKKNDFNFFRYCTNYNEDVSDLFMEYESVPNKDGYFYMNHDTILPNPDINFTRKLYLITNERSISAATLFAGLVYKYRRGVIVGRETGNTYWQMNASKFAQIQLPNSQIEITMPLVKCVFDSQEGNIPYGRGVPPHYPVNFSLEELESTNGDTILNYTLQLIHDGNYLVEKEVISTSKTTSNFKIILCTALVFGVSVLCVLLFIKKRKQKNENRKNKS